MVLRKEFFGSKELKDFFPESSHPHASSQSNMKSNEPISILHKKVSFSPSEISDIAQTPNCSGHNRRISLRSGDAMDYVKEGDEILSLQYRCETDKDGTKVEQSQNINISTCLILFIVSLL